MKRLLFLFLFGILSLNLNAQVKWDYPVKPGSEKWKSFKTHQEMVDACQIPDNLLEKMTTLELLDAWENFPLKNDIFASNSPKQGFENQKAISKALRLLLEKKDAGDVITKRYIEAKSVEKQIYEKKHPQISINDYCILKILVSQEEVVSKITNPEYKSFIEKEFPKAGKLRKTGESSLDIRTPRGTSVTNTVRSDGPDDPWQPWYFNPDEVDEDYRVDYPNAILINSSTRTYNCHAYAWADGYNSRSWINHPSEDNYWGDGSYDQVSETYATHVSYSGDHSALTTETSEIYISKWGAAPLMRHHKYYCPSAYGSPIGYYRRSVDVPQDFSSISEALSNAAPGQTSVVSFGNHSLSEDITIPNGVTLVIGANCIVNMNGHTITVGGGAISIEREANINCSLLKSGSSIIKLFPTVQSACDAANSNQTVELQRRS